MSESLRYSIIIPKKKLREERLENLLRGRWEGGSGWGIHVYPWLIHVNV